jgi:hypothetical protein
VEEMAALEAVPLSSIRATPTFFLLEFSRLTIMFELFFCLVFFSFLFFSFLFSSLLFFSFRVVVVVVFFVFKVSADMGRDFYLSSFEAVEYGLIDKVLEPNKEKVVVNGSHSL